MDLNHELLSQSQICCQLHQKGMKGVLGKTPKTLEPIIKEAIKQIKRIAIASAQSHME